jgi:hypothetical protein
MTQNNTSPLGFTQAPIVSKEGNPSWNMLQWFIKIETKTNKALTTLGLNPNAPIAGTSTTVGMINSKTQNLTTNGLLPTASLTGTIPSTQVTGFTLQNIPDGTTRFAVAMVDAAKLALINFADTTHLNKILDNINDGVTYQRFTRVASGQLALATGAIASGAAAASTATVAGVLATDSIQWSFAGLPDITYASLSVIPYVTAGLIGFSVGNPSAGSITPAPATVNYLVIR